MTMLHGEHLHHWGMRRRASREAVIWPDETTAEALHRRGAGGRVTHAASFATLGGA